MKKRVIVTINDECVNSMMHYVHYDDMTHVTVVEVNEVSRDSVMSKFVDYFEDLSLCMSTHTKKEYVSKEHYETMRDSLIIEEVLKTKVVN